MSSQSRNVARLFEKRMQLISRLSQENAEHLRLTQVSNGHQILLLKDPAVSEIEADLKDAETQIEACQQRINALEMEMAGIDEQVATATQKDD